MKMILQIPPCGGHPTDDYNTRPTFGDKKASTSKLMILHGTKKAGGKHTGFSENGYFRLIRGNNRSPTISISTPPVTTVAQVLAIRDSTVMV